MQCTCVAYIGLALQRVDANLFLIFSTENVSHVLFNWVPVFFKKINSTKIV